LAEFLNKTEEAKLRQRLSRCRQGSKAWLSIRDQFIHNGRYLIYRAASALARSGWGTPEDNEQEIYLYVLKSFHSFNPKYGVVFNTWLGYTIRSATSNLKIRLKKAHRISTRLLNSNDKIEKRFSNKAINAIDVKRFLRSLTVDERAVIKEIYFNSKKQEEVAKDRGVSNTRIGQIKRGGLERMRSVDISYADGL